MIPVAVYWPHGLSALGDLLTLEDAQAGGTAVAVINIGFKDPVAAATSLRQFHLRRWPAGPGDPPDRRADIAEITLAVECAKRAQFRTDEVFPRCLSAMGRRVREPGIDVLAIHVADRELEPLGADEFMTWGEAKHTLDDDPRTPVAALEEDLEKTGLMRVRDALQLAISALEYKGGFRYPERVNQFVDHNSVFSLAVLFDPTILRSVSLAAYAVRRLDKAHAACGIPVKKILLIAVPGLEEWTTTTL